MQEVEHASDKENEVQVFEAVDAVARRRIDRMNVECVEYLENANGYLTEEEGERDETNGDGLFAFGNEIARVAGRYFA